MSLKNRFLLSAFAWLALISGLHAYLNVNWTSITNDYLPPVIGERVITVDFAPVALGGETFWLPSSISSRDTGDANTFHRTTWTFRASYRNYHRLEVTSRILPGSEAPAK